MSSSSPTLNLHLTHTEHFRALPKQQQKSPAVSAFCKLQEGRLQLHLIGADMSLVRCATFQNNEQTQRSMVLL